MASKPWFEIASGAEDKERLGQDFAGDLQGHFSQTYRLWPRTPPNTSTQTPDLDPILTRRFQLQIGSKSSPDGCLEGVRARGAGPAGMALWESPESLEVRVRKRESPEVKQKLS